jgi:hypothetical protein
MAAARDATPGRRTVYVVGNGGKLHNGVGNEHKGVVLGGGAGECARLRLSLTAADSVQSDH